MPERFTYLALELGWALPPIILQWVVGWRFLMQEPRAWLLGILIPTVYFALADSTALGSVWTIHPAKSLGIMLGNVPVEEILFFLLTNTLVVQSILLLRAARPLSRMWAQRLRLSKRTRDREETLPSTN